MARKRTKVAKQARALLVWLESLELPTRVINALRRDLEVITGEREGEEGAGVLTGFDQAQFTEELYRPRGGQVGKVPSVAASAIEALRSAIPATVSSDAIEAVQPPQSAAAPESAEATQPAEGDEMPADAAQEGDEPAPEGDGATQEAMPAVADVALADAQEELIAEAALEAAEPPADVAPEAATESAETPATPKRRGRPPRATVVAEAPAEPAAAPEAPAKHSGRSPRDEVASEAADELPNRTRRARVVGARDAAKQVSVPDVPPAEAPALASVTAAAPMADPSFDVLLRVWRELHPQGRRATMRFMAELLGDG